MDRKINGPVMLPISEKYKDLGTVVVGKLESGRIRKGDNLLLMPNKVSPSPMYVPWMNGSKIRICVIGYCRSNIDPIGNGDGACNSLQWR